jgi:intraflagellar transport protein 56
MIRGGKANKPKVNPLTTGKGGNVAGNKNNKGQPSLDDFIARRDYTGALTLLEFRLKCQDGETRDLLMWIGYCAFHIGNYKRAEDAYRELLNAHDIGPTVHLFIACCYYFQQMFEEAEKEALLVPDENLLKTRILVHIYNRLLDENKLMNNHKKLHDSKMDYLSLAALHFLRCHFHEVI